jgi:hypothetical protein
VRAGSRSSTSSKPAPAPHTDPVATRRKRIQQAVGGAGAVIAALVGITTLVDWGKGTLDDSTPAPAAIDAQIVDVEPRGDNETLADYVRSTKPPGGTHYTREQLAERGYIFAVRVRIRGAQGQKLPLRWSLYETRRGRLPGAVDNQIGVVFAPLAREHARTWPVWLPYPPHPGEYYVRFTLEDSEGRPVDTKDTRPFRWPAAGA